MKWLIRWWQQRQRNIDLEILWPICKEQAHTLEEARGVFLVHCSLDPAWLCLTDEEVMKYVSDLV